MAPEVLAEVERKARQMLGWHRHGGEGLCTSCSVASAFLALRHPVEMDKLKHFTRYFNRFLWKYTPLEEYKCGTKHPFAVIQ